MTQSVVAVTTTGIYCRPGECAARPRPDHVLRYPTAAAAEAAGFRACLRCRPYRSSVTVSWAGSELACRAVRMILAGALDEGRESDLAARLGVSARHLRRLFTLHLGVTPSGLARSARAHFARRLLDDTDLSITEIAYAAGFGSLRQFNRVCQEIFRASPRELRRRRRAADQLVADGGLVLRLPYEGPLNWAAMLADLADQALPGVEVVSGSTYRRTIVVGGNPGLLELGPGDSHHLVLRVHLPHWEELIHVADRARRIANLDLDAREPVAALAQDPLVGPLIGATPGLRPLGTWDPFEAGVRAILSDQMSDANANAGLGQLVEQLGWRIDGLAQLGLEATFPSPHTVASADLAGLGIPAAHVRVIQTFAHAVIAGDIRLGHSASLDQLTESILDIEGTNPRVAHHIASRLGEPDAWPVADLSHEFADRWRPWRAFVAAHLQHAARSEPALRGRPTPHHHERVTIAGVEQRSVNSAS